MFALIIAINSGRDFREAVLFGVRLSVLEQLFLGFAADDVTAPALGIHFAAIDDLSHVLPPSNRKYRLAPGLTTHGAGCLE